jgi:hypothetical protein
MFARVMHCSGGGRAREDRMTLGEVAVSAYALALLPIVVGGSCHGRARQDRMALGERAALDDGRSGLRGHDAAHQTGEQT